MVLDGSGTSVVGWQNRPGARHSQGAAKRESGETGGDGDEIEDDADQLRAELRSPPVHMKCDGRVAGLAAQAAERPFDEAGLAGLTTDYEQAQQGLEQELAMEKQGASRRWACWARHAVAGPASAAHKWAKKAGMVKTRQVYKDGYWTTDPDQLINKEIERLKGLWGARAGTRTWDPGTVPLPPIDPQAIARAAARFPTRTSQTFDGFHVRHYARMSTPGLECLAISTRRSRGTEHFHLLFGSSSRASSQRSPRRGTVG